MGKHVDWISKMLGMLARLANAGAIRDGFGLFESSVGDIKSCRDLTLTVGIFSS